MSSLFQVVIECFEKLPYLEHLDISNTNLSSSRLNLLAESVKKTGVLKVLSIYNNDILDILSFNLK